MDKSLRILVYDSDDLSVGSTRVFSYGIYRDLKELGFSVHYGILDDTDGFDIVIYGKNYKNILCRDTTSHIKIQIQPSDLTDKYLSQCLKADYWIVGSYEELDYYAKYNIPIFYYPLLEKFNLPSRNISSTDEIIISYHGNKQHLESLSPPLIAALEKISSKFDIKFHAIYDVQKLGIWKKSRPDINIKDIQWNIDTIITEIVNSDIGIVPFSTPIPNLLASFTKKITGLLLPHTGAHVQDYLLQFKKCTNPGRIYLFQQCKVPVIAEISTAACSAIQNEDYGFIVYSYDGWMRALNILCSNKEKRKEIAENSFKYVSGLSSVKFVKDMIKYIQGNNI